MAKTFFDFRAANPARYQLTNERVIPGFEPMQNAYQPTVRVLEEFHDTLCRLGVRDPDGPDMATGSPRQRRGRLHDHP